MIFMGCPFNGLVLLHMNQTMRVCFCVYIPVKQMDKRISCAYCGCDGLFHACQSPQSFPSTTSEFYSCLIFAESCLVLPHILSFFLDLSI